jgi:hypothetical protein
MRYIFFMIKGITLSEISKELNVPVNTLRQRISRLGIRPITQEAIYAPEVLETLRNVPGRGKPKKQVTPEKPAKQAKGKKEKTPPRK